MVTENQVTYPSKQQACGLAGSFRAVGALTRDSNGCRSSTAIHFWNQPLYL